MKSNQSHLNQFLHLLISFIRKIRKINFKPQNTQNQLITFPFHRNSNLIIKFFSAIFNFNENPRHLIQRNNQLKCISEAKRSCQSKKWIKVLMNVIFITIEQLFNNESEKVIRFVTEFLAGFMERFFIIKILRNFEFVLSKNR